MREPAEKDYRAALCESGGAKAHSARPRPRSCSSSPIDPARSRRWGLDWWHLAASLLAFVSACSPTPKPVTRAKTFELQVLAQEKCPLPSKPGAPERAALGLKVRLTALVPEGVAANYFYASLLSGDGSRYLAELPGCVPALSGVPLLAGETREGYLNIPLPVNKVARTLVYAPPVGGYPVAARTLEIPLQAPLIQDGQN